VDLTFGGIAARRKYGIVEDYPGSTLDAWNDKVGGKYTQENYQALDEMERAYQKTKGFTRTQLNTSFLGNLNREARILEVGCNIGNQLLCLQSMGFRNLFGIEPQTYAYELAVKRLSGIIVKHGSAFNIPFETGFFDLVFTSGVLNHISPEDIGNALDEIYRCSKRYLWGYETYAKETIGMPFRTYNNLYWRADFPNLYINRFKTLKLVKREYYGNDKSMNVMYLLEKGNDRRRNRAANQRNSG